MNNIYACKVKVSNDPGSQISAKANEVILGDKNIPITKRIEQGERIKGRNTSATKIHWVMIIAAISFVVLIYLILSKQSKSKSGMAGALVLGIGSTFLVGDLMDSYILGRNSCRKK